MSAGAARLWTTRGKQRKRDNKTRHCTPPTEHDFAHEQHTHQAPELYPAVSTWHISGMMEKLPRVQACELMLADLVRRYFSNGLGSYSLRKHHQHAVVSCRKTIRVRRGHTNPAPSIQLKPLMLQGILGRDSQTRVLSFQSRKVRAKDPRAHKHVAASHNFVKAKHPSAVWQS